MNTLTITKNDQFRRGWFIAIIATAFGAIVLLFWGGPRDFDRYGPRTLSPYRLPFSGTFWVCQGNNGSLSHFRRQRFAYDFCMPEDTPVLAARGGRVLGARADCDSFGFASPANYIKIDHEDDTCAFYYHLRKDGVLVHVGDYVRQHQEIGRSGWTGRALIPHLHFEVQGSGGGTIPISFADAEPDGIPRAPWLTGR